MSLTRAQIHTHTHTFFLSLSLSHFSVTSSAFLATPVLTFVDEHEQNTNADGKEGRGARRYRGKKGGGGGSV